MFICLEWGCYLRGHVLPTLTRPWPYRKEQTTLKDRSKFSSHLPPFITKLHSFIKKYDSKRDFPALAYNKHLILCSSSLVTWIVDLGFLYVCKIVILQWLQSLRIYYVHGRKRLSVCLMLVKLVKVYSCTLYE